MSARDPLQRAKDQMEAFKRKLYRGPVPTLFGRGYHWVFGWTKGGKKVVWGPYYSAIEAERELSTLEDGEVFELDTRDVTRATREIKAELMKRGGDPDENLKRVLHRKSVE